MNARSTNDRKPCEIDDDFAQLIEKINDQLDAGEAVDQEKLIANHRRYERQLRSLLPMMCTMARMGRKAATIEADCTTAACGDDDLNRRERDVLGEYEIVREIGRGGMGVVYHARQRALHRDVAIKVLPLAALADRRQVARFQNEARAAAALHHPHIVPIYSVGLENGTHYYAMQYIDGPSLAQVLDALRRQARDNESPDRPSACSETPTQAAATQGRSDSEEGHSTANIAQLQASIATRRSVAPAQYYRTVAQWGVQAAQALAHAHECGVVHRDVKPSNLLLDVAGAVWITDFGLARLEVGSTLTAPGDLLGTLLYMSPEQVEGKGALVDHRTDVYSLGATLYELLTLQAPFASNERSVLLQKIAVDQPTPPGRLRRDVPRDLETIVLKALEKEPQQRYPTALAMAEDLQRFANQRPIRASRVSLTQRLRRSGRRHPRLVWTFIALSIAITAGSALLSEQKRRQRQSAVDVIGQELAASEAFVQGGEYASAQLHLGRAEALLRRRNYGSDHQRIKANGLARQIDAKQFAEEEYERFQQLRSRAHADLIHGGPEDSRLLQRRCEAALQVYNVLNDEKWRRQPSFLNVKQGKQRELQQNVVELLGLWAHVQAFLASDATSDSERAIYDEAFFERLDQIAAITENDGPVLHWKAMYYEDCLDDKELAQALREKAEKQPPATAMDHWLLAILDFGDDKKHTRHLQQVIRLKHDHFPSLFYLGWILYKEDRYEAAQAMFTAAIAAGGNSRELRLMPAYHGRGNALRRLGEKQLALQDFNMAIEIEPCSATYSQRGGLFSDLGESDAAINDFTEAIRLSYVDPRDNPRDCARHLAARGTAFMLQGEFESALADFNESIRLSPDEFLAFNQRGYTYTQVGEYDKAIEDLTEAIRLDPDNVVAYVNRAIALRELGRFGPAAQDFDAAIRLNPQLPNAYRARAIMFLSLRRWDEAVADLSEALRLGPQSAAAHVLRANAYREKGDLNNALADYNEALELHSDKEDGSSTPVLIARAETLASLGREQEAGSDLNQLLEATPKTAQEQIDLAWNLICFPLESLRSADRAVELAEQGVANLPERSDFWGILGAARYRADDLVGAREALARSAELCAAADAYRDVFRAMTEVRLGDEESARRYYQQAVAHMPPKDDVNVNFERFRQEAADLLGFD